MITRLYELCRKYSTLNRFSMNSKRYIMLKCNFLLIGNHVTARNGAAIKQITLTREMILKSSRDFYEQLNRSSRRIDSRERSHEEEESRLAS